MKATHKALTRRTFLAAGAARSFPRGQTMSCARFSSAKPCASRASARPGARGYFFLSKSVRLFAALSTVLVPAAPRFLISHQYRRHRHNRHNACDRTTRSACRVGKARVS